MKYVLRRKSCKNKFDIRKPFDSILQNHIIINKSNMKFF
jgi:hypothetical protein